MSQIERRGPAFDRVLGAAGGAGLGILVALALGPEVAGVIGNASGPLIEELSYATRKILSRQAKRVESAVGEAVIEGGFPLEELIRRSLADDRRAALLTTALQAAAVAQDEATVRALGRAYARGVLSTDDAKVDEHSRVASTLASLDPMDVRVLHRLRGGEYWIKRPKEGADALVIIDADPGVDDVVDTVVARLATLGLITDEATTYAALGKWQITTFGIRCLTALLEVGYTATEDDGDQVVSDS